MEIEKIIMDKQCAIIDVRSQAEFMGGHVEGSVNIPLQELPNRVDELKGMNKPLVLCCASGNRSAQAHRLMTQLGVESYNGGSWMDVNFYASKTA